MAQSENAVSSCCGALPPADIPIPIRGQFELMDHFERPVNEHSWDDRHLLVFFGFTHCAVVCPRELAKLSAALTLLGPDAERVQPLYISVDPERDSPARLRDYLATRAPQFLGLTGSTESVEHAKRNFRVFAARKDDPDAPGGYAVPHTAFTYLLAPGGGFLQHFSDVASAQALADALLRQIDRG